MTPFEIAGPVMPDDWDSFVGSHPLGEIYHLTAWRQVLERCFKHIKGYGCVIRDENGRIRAGIPAFRVRSWLTGTRLVCAPFATLFDPLVSDRGQTETLCGALMKLSRQLGCSHIEIRTHQGGQFLERSAFTPSRHFKLHYLKLEGSLDTLKRGFHRTCVRQRIARAEKSGLRLGIAEGMSDLRVFYDLLSLTRRRRGLPLQPYAYFQALWEVLRPQGMIRILIARKGGSAIAAVLLLTYKERVTIEFAASDESFLDLSPVHFLFWEAIQWAHREGYRVIDFGRTSPQNRSLMEFKDRWGAECVDLPHFYYPRQAAGMDSRKEAAWKYALLKKIITSPMPDSFREIIGAVSYRHLG